MKTKSSWRSASIKQDLDVKKIRTKVKNKASANKGGGQDNIKI